MLPYWEKYFTVSWIYFLRFQYDMLPFWEIFSRFLNMFLTFSIWCVALLRNLFPFLEYLLGVCVILFSSLPIGKGLSSAPWWQHSLYKYCEHICKYLENVFILIYTYKYAASSFCYISFWEGSKKWNYFLRSREKIKPILTINFWNEQSCWSLEYVYIWVSMNIQILSLVSSVCTSEYRWTSK